jgi:hypothetical protein
MEKKTSAEKAVREMSRIGTQEERESTQRGLAANGSENPL